MPLLGTLTSASSVNGREGQQKLDLRTKRENERLEQAELPDAGLLSSLTNPPLFRAQPSPCQKTPPRVCAALAPHARQTSRTAHTRPRGRTVRAHSPVGFYRGENRHERGSDWPTMHDRSMAGVRWTPRPRRLSSRSVWYRAPGLSHLLATLLSRNWRTRSPFFFLEPQTAPTFGDHSSHSPPVPATENWPVPGQCPDVSRWAGGWPGAPLCPCPSQPPELAVTPHLAVEDSRGLGMSNDLPKTPQLTSLGPSSGTRALLDEAPALSSPLRGPLKRQRTHAPSPCATQPCGLTCHLGPLSERSQESRVLREIT